MKRRHRKKRFKLWKKWNDRAIIPHPNYKIFSVDFTDSGYSVATMRFNKRGELVLEDK